MALTDKELEAKRLILAEIEKALKLLEAHLTKFCQETKGTSIPMTYISASILILLNGLKKETTETTDQSDDTHTTTQ